MQLTFDHYHLLCIENPNIPKLKEYRFSISGYQISSYDKGIFAYHKRQRKLINLKNLGEGMQLCFCQKEKNPDYQFNLSMLERTLAMFSGFNEETGEKYRFLPFYSKDIVKLQQELSEDFSINCQITKEQQGTFVRGLQTQRSAPESDEELLSYLFALVLLYGKFEIKNNELLAAKAHIPLFSLRNSLFKLFAEYYIPHLQELGIFVTSSTVQHGGKTILQLTFNDLELLECFAAWLNQYQNAKLSVYSTSSHQKQQSIKDQLLDFMLNSPELEQLEKENIIESLKMQRLKFIKY